MQLSRWLPVRTLAVVGLAAAALACTDRADLVATAPPPVSSSAPPSAFVSPVSGVRRCVVGDPAFTSQYRSDLNLALNDYGRILADADDPQCAQAAHDALYNKVHNTIAAMPTAYDQWLQGGLVALVLASANRIGANGFYTRALDTEVRKVLGFRAGHDPSGCSKESTNTCMEDYALAASGFGWAAAFTYRRGDDPIVVQRYRDSTRKYIDSAFKSVCIHVQFGELVLCKGTVDSIRVGRARTLSLNHTQQEPSYGFGLMTSIAAAVLGLEASGVPYTFSDDNRVVARALFEEMQRAVSGAGPNFLSNCPTPFRDMSGNWQPGALTFCGRIDDQYQPQMYRLDAFYNRYLGGIPGAGAYQSATFNDNLFFLDSNDGGGANGARDFFSFGRHQTYGQFGYSWVAQPREYLPFDSYDPIGYLDVVDAGGVARGWSCDKDVPLKAANVDVYAGGQFAVRGSAFGGSEPAVNSLCGGGTAHRFAITLPAWTKGLDIVAYGLDYVGFGFTQLTCLQSPRCAW